jgi:hypothetical protein
MIGQTLINRSPNVPPTATFILKKKSLLNGNDGKRNENVNTNKCIFLNRSWSPNCFVNMKLQEDVRQ